MLLDDENKNTIKVSKSFGRNAKKSEHAMNIDDECNATYIWAN
jgi:hypothetical protein